MPTARRSRPTRRCRSPRRRRAPCPRSRTTGCSGTARSSAVKKDPPGSRSTICCRPRASWACPACRRSAPRCWREPPSPPPTAERHGPAGRSTWPSGSIRGAPRSSSRARRWLGTKVDIPPCSWNEIVGYTRLGSVPLFWRLTVENLLIWAISAVVVAGALFVALQLAVHGAVVDRRHRRDREPEAADHHRLSGRARGLHPAGAGARGLGGAAALLGDPVAALRAALGARGDRDRRGRADRDAVPARARRRDASRSSCRRRWTPRAASRSAACMAA